jgi:hypothetical protein
MSFGYLPPEKPEKFIPKRSLHPYLEQLLKTATKGNVEVEYSVYENRMRLRCKVCFLSLTAPEMTTSNELDYGVQEFIKLHAHVGGPTTGGYYPSSMSVSVSQTGVQVTTQIVPEVVQPKKTKLLKIATGRKFR